MKAAIERLASLPLMLIFTGSAFVVLVVSVVLMAAESLLSAVLPQAKEPKKDSCNTGVSQTGVASEAFSKAI
ncbi:hypothetical protein [Aerosakkonema funiforme]|uniref:hypothetical protein n=1 Tax=Aerosakkonema funiforme TaxID=1246630 RepID=UPI0035B9772D